MPAKPQIECEQQHPSLYVRDISAAVDFYTKQLGFRLGFTGGDPPTFAGVNLGQVQMFLEQGTPGPRGARCTSWSTTPTSYASSTAPTASRSSSRLTTGPTDCATTPCAIWTGTDSQFGHHLLDAGPPIEIERVDVPVRLEKRLAALLHDLAEHKRMSLSELSRRDPAAHLRAARRRRRQPAHERDAGLHPGAEAEARHRLRQPRELPFRRGVAP